MMSTVTHNVASNRDLIAAFDFAWTFIILRAQTTCAGAVLSRLCDSPHFYTLPFLVSFYSLILCVIWLALSPIEYKFKGYPIQISLRLARPETRATERSIVTQHRLGDSVRPMAIDALHP